LTDFAAGQKLQPLRKTLQIVQGIGITLRARD